MNGKTLSKYEGQEWPPFCTPCNSPTYTNCLLYRYLASLVVQQTQVYSTLQPCVIIFTVTRDQDALTGTSSRLLSICKNNQSWQKDNNKQIAPSPQKNPSNMADINNTDPRNSAVVAWSGMAGPDASPRIISPCNPIGAFHKLNKCPTAGMDLGDLSNEPFLPLFSMATASGHRSVIGMVRQLQKSECTKFWLSLSGALGLQESDLALWTGSHLRIR